MSYLDKPKVITCDIYVNNKKFGKSMSLIPVLDIAPFLAGSTTDKMLLAKRLDEACSDVGFFCLTGHGVRDEDCSLFFGDRCHILPVQDQLLFPAEYVRVKAGGSGGDK